MSVINAVHNTYLILLAAKVPRVFQLGLGRRLVPRRVDGCAVSTHARHRVVVLFGSFHSCHVIMTFCLSVSYDCFILYYYHFDFSSLVISKDIAFCALL